MTANADPPKDQRDPACCASLLMQGPRRNPACSRLTLSTEYPLTDHEPPTVELDEDTKAQLLATGKEDTDPLDYVKAENVHGLLAVPRAYIATDKSAAAERVADEELKEALLEEYKLRNPTKGASLFSNEPAVGTASKRVAEAEAAVKKAAQSSELRPELVWVTFDPNSYVFTVAAEYLNQLPETASVAISLPRTKGLTLADLDVDIAGYPNKSAYQPIKKAEAIFKEACASANKSASIQAMDKSAHTVTVKVPAATAAAPARFTARFVLTCDDADAKALLLPSKPGAPTLEAYDFAVQPLSQDGDRAVAFSLHIKPFARGKLAVPSRAAAKLDAQRRGVPTYWVAPDEECDANGYHLDFNTPSLQPPCLRFRVVAESDSEYDFVTDSLKNAKIDATTASAKVLCYAPVNEDSCVAVVEVAAPQRMPDMANAEGHTKHGVIVVDKSYSMEMRQNGSPDTNRNLAFKEVELMTKKLQDLPRVFAKSGIASKNDTFLLTIIGFHSTAGLVCSRVPVVPGCEESTRALAKAATDLLASTDAGGTNYKSWVDALSDHVRPSDHVALALLTDGQLWDLPAFKVAYASLKASVTEFEACAIGCGAWANHDTVKEVATKGGGEALIESVDSSVSSMATRLLGKCFASMAIKHSIIVEDHVLAHKGPSGDAPTFRENQHHRPRGAEAIYSLGLGAKQVFVVAGSHCGSRVTVCGLAQVVGDGTPVKFEVAGCNVPRDVTRVLRHFDPLFASDDVEFYTCRSDPTLNDKLREGIGVYNQTTTSNVVKVAEYDLSIDGRDHSLHPLTKAVVPPIHDNEARSGRFKEGVLNWLRDAPSDRDMPSARTTYEHHTHCGYPSHWGDDCNYYGYSMFRSLGATNDDTDHNSEPEFRSCSAVADAAPTPPPPSAPANNKPTKGEVEKPKDNNATPTFDEVSKLYHSVTLLPYLNNHTLALRAVESLLDELKATGKKLEAKRAEDAAGGGNDPMVDVVSAALDEVAGPELENVVAKLWPLLSVLSALVMRYHLELDLNLYNEAIGEGDVAKALCRVGYMIKIAERVKSKVSGYSTKYWRPVLTTKKVKDKDCGFTFDLTWVAEHRAREARDGPYIDRVHADSVRPLVRKVIDLFTALFNDGGYLGGTFVAEADLYCGDEPVSMRNTYSAFRGAAFVSGERFDARHHIHDEMTPVALKAISGFA